MTIAKYYRNSTLYPAIIVIVSTLIFSIVENKDYISEWFTREAVIEMAFISSISYSIIFSILCLPIFAVRNKVVSRNKLLTALSWFLLPAIGITIVVTHEIHYNLTYNENFGTDFLYVVLMNVPFMGALIGTYLMYRKNNYSKTL